MCDETKPGGVDEELDEERDGILDGEKGGLERAGRRNRADMSVCVIRAKDNEGAHV